MNKPVNNGSQGRDQSGMDRIIEKTWWQEHRKHLTWAAVAVLALLLHSFVDFNLQIYSNSLLFAFLCAFLLRDGADARQRAPQRRLAPTRSRG